jgi:hypothetical protein
MSSLLKCKVEGCGFDALNETDLKKHMEEEHLNIIFKEVTTLEQEAIQNTIYKEMSDFKSLWEERTSLIIDLIKLIKTGSATDDTIIDLKENSEDIAKTIFTVFKQDSISKNKEHEEYYYELGDKSHPTKGSPLNPEEDEWIRNYMSVSMFTLILKENILLLKDYFKFIKENDIKGQQIVEERISGSIASTTGFLKSMGTTWDLETINKKLVQYLRNIKKMVVVLVDSKDTDIDADVVENQLDIAREIAQILFEGMVEWKARQ